MEQGAAGHVRLASDPGLQGVSGKYFAAPTPGGGTSAGGPHLHAETQSSRESYEAGVAARLWELSRDLSGARWDALRPAAAR